MQVVGRNCHVCGDKIIIAIKGVACEPCQRAFHKKCWDQVGGCNHEERAAPDRPGRCTAGAPESPGQTPRPETGATAKTTEGSEHTLFPMKLASSWGYMDRSGQVVITPRFEHAWPFSEGLAVVKLDGAHGYIDGNGHVVIDPTFRLAEPFFEGLASVVIDRKSCIIDRTGNVIELDQSLGDMIWSIGRFSEGLAAVALFMGSPVAYIDNRGQAAFAAQFEEGGMFSGGLAPVKLFGKWGYVDKTGVTSIQPVYDAAGRFANGLAPVSVEGKWGYVARNGSMCIAPMLDNAAPFCEGLAAVQIGDKCGYVNDKGQVVIEPMFDSACGFSEGLAVVSIQRRLGYIDRSGRIVVEPRPLNAASGFRGGLACLEDYDGGWCYVDRSGEVVWASPSSSRSYGSTNFGVLPAPEVAPPHPATVPPTGSTDRLPLWARLSPLGKATFVTMIVVVLALFGWLVARCRSARETPALDTAVARAEGASGLQAGHHTTRPQKSGKVFRSTNPQFSFHYPSDWLEIDDKLILGPQDLHRRRLTKLTISKNPQGPRTTDCQELIEKAKGGGVRNPQLIGSGGTSEHQCTIGGGIDIPMGVVFPNLPSDLVKDRQFPFAWLTHYFVSENTLVAMTLWMPAKPWRVDDLTFLNGDNQTSLATTFLELVVKSIRVAQSSRKSLGASVGHSSRDANKQPVHEGHLDSVRNDGVKRTAGPQPSGTSPSAPELRRFSIPGSRLSFELPSDWIELPASRAGMPGTTLKAFGAQSVTPTSRGILLVTREGPGEATSEHPAHSACTRFQFNWLEARRSKDAVGRSNYVTGRCLVQGSVANGETVTYHAFADGAAVFALVLLSRGKDDAVNSALRDIFLKRIVPSLR